MRGKNEILVVDDSKFNRVTFIDILSDVYNVVEAENGRHALDILRERKGSIALIILDLVMPVMDGFGFLEEFREVQAYKNIPVIVATTSDDVENEKRCLQLGAWDFIPKSNRREIIRFRILNAIDKSKVHALEYDSLTGIYNQQKFYQVTREMLDRPSDEKYAFIHVDIDRFKMINSFYGASEGDRVICHLADAIKGTMSHYEKCTYGRMNGDIFGICVAYENEEELLHIARTIEKQIKAYDVHYYLETCAGIYMIEDKDMEVTVIFDSASIAARQCKGLYTVHEAFYTKEMGEKLIREQNIINQMDEALAMEQFIVYLQPKYDVKKRIPYGAEALVRWRKPDGRMISPGEFIPIFEQNGFIIKLDFYVWEKVCQFIRKELDAGKFPAPISVNVSRVNLYSPKFLENLINLVEKYKIPPKYLHLELTESAFSDNAAVMGDAIKYLHRAGFTILMDDFGSGYSSLNILKDIKLDVLKIDMKFLSKGDEETNARGAKIIEAIILMAHSLQMPIIAEGVEEEEQVQMLSSLGCHYIQGYYFAKPMPIPEYKDLINRLVG